MSGCHNPEKEPPLIQDLKSMAQDLISLNAVFVKHERRIQALEKERDYGVERIKNLERESAAQRTMTQKVPYRCIVCKGKSVAWRMTDIVINVYKKDKNTYSVEFDIQPLVDKIGLSKQRCAELLVDEMMKVMNDIGVF